MDKQVDKQTYNQIVQSLTPEQQSIVHSGNVTAMVASFVVGFGVALLFLTAKH